MTTTMPGEPEKADEVRKQQREREESGTRVDKPPKPPPDSPFPIKEIKESHGDDE